MKGRSNMQRGGKGDESYGNRDSQNNHRQSTGSHNFTTKVIIESMMVTTSLQSSGSSPVLEQLIVYAEQLFPCQEYNAIP